jgi:hypothetical protein
MGRQGDSQASSSTRSISTITFLVKGEGFTVDASVVKADANRARGVPGAEVIDWNKGEGPSRAVREYLTFGRLSRERTRGSAAATAARYRGCASTFNGV